MEKDSILEGSFENFTKHLLTDYTKIADTLS